MKKKKLMIIFTTLVLSLTVLFSTVYCVYNKFYKIDVRHFEFSILARAGNSPDKKHDIGIWIYRTTEENDISYIMGRVYKVDNNGDEKDGKIFFWQKVKTSSIMNKTVNGMVIDNWVDFNWVDAQTIYINGITLNSNSTYDYRRK
jgi:hypothetical protein